MGIGPVRHVHLLLHTGAVEAAKGKTIDRKDVAVVPIQPALESQQSFRRRQLAGGQIAKPETNRVRRDGRNPLFYRQCPALEGAQGLGPILAWMHVGAVGKMKAVAELHQVAGNLNFGHWPRKRSGL